MNRNKCVSAVMIAVLALCFSILTAASVFADSLVKITAPSNGETIKPNQVPVSASRKGALDNGWKPHPVRNNQSTGSESWNRSGNVRFKRRQLGGRDGH